MILPNINDPNYQSEIWMKIREDIVPDICNYYYVSNHGRFLNDLTGTYLPQNANYNKNKYITLRVSLNDGNSLCVQPHRIALATFSPVYNWRCLDVNHKDGVKYHNWIWNLEWCTKSENIQHALNNNLFNLGETRGNSKLTELQVRAICEKIDEGKGPAQIAREMNITNCNIEKIVQNIKNGLSWKHVSKDYKFANSTYSSTTNCTAKRYLQSNSRKSGLNGNV